MLRISAISQKKAEHRVGLRRDPRFARHRFESGVLRRVGQPTVAQCAAVQSRAASKICGGVTLRALISASVGSEDELTLDEHLVLVVAVVPVHVPRAFFDALSHVGIPCRAFTAK